MAVRGIFKLVERIKKTVDVSIVKTQTQSKKEISMRRGPATINLELRLPSCTTNSAQYTEIIEQLAIHRVGKQSHHIWGEWFYD